MGAAPIYSLRWFGERAAAGMAIIGLCSAVFGIVWMVASNEVEELFSNLSGVTRLTEEVRIHTATTSSAIDRLTGIVERNADMIQQLHPPRIVDYDSLLSRIFSPCIISGECEAQFRARRTHFGEACGLPVVVGRFVTDRNGLLHPVQPPSKTIPTRLDGEWALRPIIFQVPARVPEGIATFHMLLEYDCVGKKYTEETPRLPFQAIE